MAQNDIQITTTPPLPGLTLVQGINGALQSLATDFAGSIDPAAIGGVGPYCTWADTGNGLLKRRNAAGTDWVVEGELFQRTARRNGDPTQDFSANNISISSVNGGQLAGFRNKILNGRFNINQAGAASRTAAVGYNFDQWYYDGTYLYQPIPTEDVYDGTYTLSWEGSSTAAWSLNALGSSVQNAQSYTPVAKGGQIIVSGHTNEHLWVRFATDLANLNKVQLEPGDTATPYEERPKSLEEFLCQRFYESSFADNVAPGSANLTVDETGMYVPYTMFNGVCVQLLQIKRSLPTIAVYAPLTPTSAGKIRQADNGTILDFSLDFTFRTMFVGSILGGTQTAYQFGYTASSRI